MLQIQLGLAGASLPTGRPAGWPPTRLASARTHGPYGGVGRRSLAHRKIRSGAFYSRHPSRHGLVLIFPRCRVPQASAGGHESHTSTHYAYIAGLLLFLSGYTRIVTQFAPLGNSSSDQLAPAMLTLACWLACLRACWNGFERGVRCRCTSSG